MAKSVVGSRSASMSMPVWAGASRSRSVRAAGSTSSHARRFTICAIWTRSRLGARPSAAVTRFAMAQELRFDHAEIQAIEPPAKGEGGGFDDQDDGQKARRDRSQWRDQQQLD